MPPDVGHDGVEMPEVTVAQPIPFEEVYRLYKSRVIGLCAALGSREVAEDIAADVFMAAYMAYERVQPDPESVHNWLFRIAKNRTIDHIRRSRRQQDVLNLMGRSQWGTRTVEGEAESHAQLQRVVDAVAELCPRDRMVIGLRIRDGLRFTQIAKALGISESAAMSATYRALRHAQMALSQA